MADAFTAILAAHVVGGAASGAAKHLTESVLKSGQAWLAARFKDHQEKAIEKAIVNASDFSSALAQKVAALEENQLVDRSVIDRALEEPSFGSLLQCALIGAAQTENEDTHDLLASIVSSRLTASSQSVLAVASQMAATAVAHCSPSQLRLLGFAISLNLRWNELNSASFPTKEAMIEGCRGWFETRFAPYQDLSARHVDLLHLEAVSCLSIGWVQHDLNAVIAANWASGEWQIGAEDLLDYSVGESILRLWKSLANVHLTSIGTLIGILVSDCLCKANATRFTEEWTN